MIDFLKMCEISDDVIKQIEKVNSSANLYNLNCNDLDTVKIIDFLRSVGVKCIEQLLIYKIDLFFTSYDMFKKKFNKYDVEKLVELINDDYNVIDKL